MFSLNIDFFLISILFSQIEALHQRVVTDMTEAAYLCGTNVVCYQEAWSKLNNKITLRGAGWREEREGAY